jgi:hypothetical protein
MEGARLNKRPIYNLTRLSQLLRVSSVRIQKLRSRVHADEEMFEGMMHKQTGIVFEKQRKQDQNLKTSASTAVRSNSDEVLKYYYTSES